MRCDATRGRNWRSVTKQVACTPTTQPAPTTQSADRAARRELLPVAVLVATQPAAADLPGVRMDLPPATTKPAPTCDLWRR